MARTSEFDPDGLGLAFLSAADLVLAEMLEGWRTVRRTSSRISEGFPWSLDKIITGCRELAKLCDR